MYGCGTDIITNCHNITLKDKSILGTVSKDASKDITDNKIRFVVRFGGED